MALFNVSAKINMMTKKVMDDVRLAIKQGPKLELVLHTDYNRLFFDFVKILKLQ